MSSLGEHRVRVEFNVGQNPMVEKFKRMSAELIDMCEELKNAGQDPRTASLAQTAYEDACMWAVKSATSRP